MRTGSAFKGPFCFFRGLKLASHLHWGLAVAGNDEVSGRCHHGPSSGVAFCSSSINSQEAPSTGLSELELEPACLAALSEA